MNKVQFLKQHELSKSYFSARQPLTTGKANVITGLKRTELFKDMNDYDLATNSQTRNDTIEYSKSGVANVIPGGSAIESVNAGVHMPTTKVSLRNNKNTRNTVFIPNLTPKNKALDKPMDNFLVNRQSDIEKQDQLVSSNIIPKSEKNEPEHYISGSKTDDKFEVPKEQGNTLPTAELLQQGRTRLKKTEPLIKTPVSKPFEEELQAVVARRQEMSEDNDSNDSNTSMLVETDDNDEDVPIYKTLVGQHVVIGKQVYNKKTRAYYVGELDPNTNKPKWVKYKESPQNLQEKSTLVLKDGKVVKKRGTPKKKRK